MAKAILLLSGGLDSTLAGKLLLELGVEVEAVNFVSPFCQCTPKSQGCPAGMKAAEQLGIPLKVFACGEDYLEIIKHPRFGHGSGVNACVDCRIHMFTRARKIMIERGADFVATGEVLGERPMSQHRRAMAIIERESGLSGRIVRPLCAQLMPPSEPETEGIIERGQMKAIQGRRRKPQFDLARELGITDYLCPAGGCLLTEKEFAARFRDLLEHKPDFGMADARMLRYGRHFRLPGGTKVIVGREEAENEIIERAATDGDVLMLPKNVPGPSVLCREPSNVHDVITAAGFIAAYTKGGTALDVEANDGSLFENVQPLDAQVIAQWRISANKQRLPEQEEVS